MIRLLPLLAGALLFALPAQAQWVSFDESEWGAGQPYDLTSRVPRPVPLDSYLPLDTGTWTTDNITCTRSALTYAISQAAPRTVIQLPSNCTITLTSGSTIWSISNSRDELVIRGNADGRSRIVFDPEGTPPDDGWPHMLFNIGSDNPATIASWSWDGGYAMGSDIARSNQPISEVYPGDIVRLEMDQWSSTVDRDYREYYRVKCARWSNGSVHGTTADCAGVTGNNQIKLDRKFQFPMDGAGLQAGPFAGHTIVHVERKGGGSRTTNMTENFGIENITVHHTKPAAVKGYFAMMEFHGCMECWVSNVTAETGWGNSWGELKNSASRVLIEDSGFQGPLWRPRCRMDVEEINPNTSPVQVRFRVNSECREMCTGLERVMSFPDDFPEPRLAGKYAQCSCVECDRSDGQVTVALTDTANGNPINGAGMNRTPGGWVTQLNTYNIGGFYLTSQSSGIQMVNNWFRNARVGVIQQQGAFSSVLAYNYFKTDPEFHCSRFLFIHGGNGTASLWEGNHGDCGYVTTATAEQGLGLGPFFTMLYNRGIPRTDKTYSLGDQCGRADICNEAEEQEGNASDSHNYLGNFLPGYSNLLGDHKLGDCRNSNKRGSKPGGCDAPYQLYAPHLHKNIWYAEEMEDDIESVQYNPTIVSPDIAADLNDNVDRKPAAWASVRWPTSLLYDTVQQTPSWWCEESGPFPNIGAPVDDNNGGAPIVSKLPAQLRMEGRTCTRVDGQEPPPEPVPVLPAPVLFE